MQCPVCVEAQWAFSCTESLSFDTVDIRPLCLVKVRARSSPHSPRRIALKWEPLRTMREEPLALSKKTEV